MKDPIFWLFLTLLFFDFTLAIGIAKIFERLERLEECFQNVLGSIEKEDNIATIEARISKANLIDGKLNSAFYKGGPNASPDA